MEWHYILLRLLYYLLLTRNIGTPFNDSLTNEQRNIKKNAVDIEKNILFRSSNR